MSIRTERVAKLLQREVADILQTELELPTLVTVTDARATKDLGIGYIYVSVLGETATQRQAAFKHLQDLTPQVRSALAARVRHDLRIVPEIKFFLDESLEKSRRLDDLFDQIRAERARREG